MNRKFTALFLIIILAAFLRIWDITRIPVGFNADEAAIGYNAWSILKTGRDEFGNFLPIAFTSFGDFKPPLYFYLTVPFVAIFDLSEFAVRAPSAIFGVLTVFTVFALTQKLFKNFWLSVISSLLLAISPWHIHYSRGGWETNLFTFLLTLGVFLLLQALEKPKWLYFSSIVFALSFYSYQGARVVMPTLVILLALFFKGKLLKIKRQVVLAAALGLIIILPALYTFLTGPGFSRFSGISIFTDSGPFWQINERRGQHTVPDSAIVQLFHNKVQAYGLVVLKNFAAHFNSNFLFIEGDPIPRNQVLEHGTLLIPFFPFLLIGTYFLIIKSQKLWPVVFLWLLAAPTASALTFQSPQALRSASMVVPLSIIAGSGFYYLLVLFEKYKSILKIFAVAMILILGFSFWRFWHFYSVHNPKQIPIAFTPGFSELVPYVFEKKDKFDKVIVTDRYDQPYILFLFYSRYDPSLFSRQAKLTPRDRFGFATVRSFDKFEFRRINWQEDSELKNVLLVGTGEEIPKGVKIDKIIYFPNNQPAFLIVRT